MPDVKTLVVQISVILIVSHSVSWLLRKCSQPRVVGEMVAGILLGPSLLGWVAPGLSGAVFPPESLGPLYALSQIGLLIFMFMVGLELDTKKLRRLGHVAVVISNASIVVPFVLGALLASQLYQRVAAGDVPFNGFVLFIGAAMSVTAFPVLARILTEQNLLGTRLGALSIICAAVGDVTAWCILAGIVGVVRAEVNQLALWQMLAGLAAYFAFMLLVLKPVFKGLAARSPGASDTTLAVLLPCAFASSWATEWLGIHALFGAFFAGVIMPKEEGFAEDVVRKLRPLVVVVLLPLFFAFTGLRTDMRLVVGPAMLLYSVLVFAVAVAGKFGGSAVAARVMGVPWREAAAIGVLMNTRGLMELVILNIGLDIGVLNRSLFSMMVLMAVGTTLMTTPLLSLVGAGEQPEAAAEAEKVEVAPAG
jgi:Kef-type K+ transport system membrane component KefB